MKKIILLLCVCAAIGNAQVVGGTISKVGTTAAAFLEIPIGARAMGMGSAFVATADDATGLYWNPAGIARLPNKEVLFNHANWIGDMSHDYVGLTLPLEGFGTLGLSFIGLTMPEMNVTTIEKPEGTGERFTAGSYALGIHYARTLSDKFSIGFTAKYITESIWDMSSSAFAVDAGVLFTTQFLNGMRIGASIMNFGTDMKLSGRDTRTFYAIDQTKLGSNARIPQNIEMDSWPLPMNFQFGIAVDVVKSETHLFTVAIDALHPADNNESLNLGAEYGFQSTFFLRAGYQNLYLKDGESGLTAGAGIMANLFGENLKGRLDYAYSDMGRLKSVNVVSLSVIF